jgi:frataxin-like iron-binding protein CyaY
MEQQMESDMDRQDFEVTARETFELIHQAIDTLALDGVESYPQEDGLKLIFDDATYYEFTRDDAAMGINAHFGGEVNSFYWDAVEEQWYRRGDEYALTAVLSAQLSGQLGRDVDMSELL